MSGAKRSPAAPDIPTISEAGVPGYQASGWVGVLAPAGTPKAIVARLNAEFNKVLKMPDVSERLSNSGAEPAGGTSEQFAAFIASELVKWTRVVKVSGARLE